MSVAVRSTLRLPRLSEVDAERFWSRVDKDSSSGCWTWTGAVGHNGYGTFYIRKPTPGTFRAHRITWAEKQGSVPFGFDLDHVVCRNTLCVNPDHLEIVTMAVNAWRRDGRFWLSEMSDLLYGVKDADGDIDRDTFTTAAVCELLRLSPGRVTAACLSGDLVAYKGAGLHRHTRHPQWYVTRDALYCFILNRGAEDAGVLTLKALTEQRDADLRIEAVAS